MKLLYRTPWPGVKEPPQPASQKLQPPCSKKLNQASPVANQMISKNKNMLITAYYKIYRHKFFLKVLLGRIL